MVHLRQSWTIIISASKSPNWTLQNNCGRIRKKMEIHISENQMNRSSHHVLNQKSQNPGIAGDMDHPLPSWGSCVFLEALPCSCHQKKYPTAKHSKALLLRIQDIWKNTSIKMYQSFLKIPEGLDNSPSQLPTCQATDCFLRHISSRYL